MEKGSYICILHLQIDQSVLSLVTAVLPLLVFASVPSFFFLCFPRQSFSVTTLAVQDGRSLFIWQ